MKKKKILLLSDDLRMHSGIATQAKEFVMGTIHKYDWVQLGGAVKHPEQGKIIDMSEACKSEHGIKDAYLKIYPISGYGNPQIIKRNNNNRKTRCYNTFYRPKILDLVIQYGTRNKTKHSYYVL